MVNEMETNPPPEQAAKEARKNWPRMNMNEIDDVARMLAVAWIENYEKIGGIEIESKIKLASDIQHYGNDRVEAYQASLKKMVEARMAELKAKLSAVKSSQSRATYAFLIQECERFLESITTAMPLTK